MLQDGLRKTLESFSHLRAECQPKKGGPSKASVYLGRGRGTFICFCFFYDARLCFYNVPYTSSQVISLEVIVNST